MTPPVSPDSSRLAELLREQTAARQGLQSALAELERRHASILNSVNEIVFQTDLGGNWTFLNSAWSDYLEHSVSGNLGHPFVEHLHPDDQSRARELLDALAAGRAELVRAELRFRSASGREQWFELLARPTVEGEDAGRGITGTLSDISARKRAEAEVARLHREMVETSRQAGMAEIATGVLHNVGNVLNSVNVSATLVIEQLQKSKAASVGKVARLLAEHQGDLGGFLSGTPQGRQLPEFLAKLADHLEDEQELLTREMEGLKKNIDHIKQIVAMQQGYARISGAFEPLAMTELLEDAFSVISTSLVHQQVEVVREFEEVPLVLVDRHKVLQILINLLSNAKEALYARPEGRRLTLRIAPSGGSRVRLEVRDNGAGIPAEDLTRIFNHGFSTKKSGHGFGLHSGANAAKEMKGTLTAESRGPGHGSTFALELPVADHQLRAQAGGKAAA